MVMGQGAAVETGFVTEPIYGTRAMAAARAVHPAASPIADARLAARVTLGQPEPPAVDAAAAPCRFSADWPTSEVVGLRPGIQESRLLSLVLRISD